MVMDMDAVAKSLPANRPDWAYAEERQQNRFKCARCQTSYDILGEHAGCPTCGKRNCLEVFGRHIARVEAAMARADSGGEIDSDNLIKGFSAFEAMAKDIRQQLALFPATPRRKKEIAKLSFQQIRLAEEAQLNGSNRAICLFTATGR